MGVQLRLWSCWVTTQQSFKETTVAWHRHPRCSTWQNDCTPWHWTYGNGPQCGAPPIWLEEWAPNPTVPVITDVPLSMLAPSSWEKEDPPWSISRKWPHPLGKTKAGLWPWNQVCNVTAVEFQNTLQIARATKGADHTLEQHVSISCMNKHEKALVSGYNFP